MEQSVQSLSDSVPKVPGGESRCFPPQMCGHPYSRGLLCDSGH